MRRIFLILIAMVFTTSAIYGQKIEKCDGSVVLSIKNRVGQLTKKDVKVFLLIFGKECRNNVEFSQFSNEVLFLVLDRQTDLLIRTIIKEKRRIDIEEILDDMSSPIHDQINVKSLIPKIEKIKITSELKDRIIEALKTADAKSN